MPLRPGGETRGGLFSRLTNAAETIKRESESFNNSAERREDVDKKTSSLDSIVNDLAPQPRDKVRVEYSLLRSGASAPLLSDTAEVEAAGLQAFLEKFLDAVSAAVLK